MNNGQMDRGNENPTQYSPCWLRKTTKTPSQVGRHRHSNQGPPECESRALPWNHLARFFFFFFVLWVQLICAIKLAKDKSYELCSFSNLSVTSPTSQLILQPFRCFTYVTPHSPTLPLFHLRHSSFSNPSFAFPTSQALHLIRLASRPWIWHRNVLSTKPMNTFLCQIGFPVAQKYPNSSSGLLRYC